MLGKGILMYVSPNFRSRKALLEALEQGKHVQLCPQGLESPVTDGTACLQGPHYPEPHRWYATATVKGGKIVAINGKPIKVQPPRLTLGLFTFGAVLKHKNR
jgi:hypothetical protein